MVSGFENVMRSDYGAQEIDWDWKEMEGGETRDRKQSRN